MLFEHFGTTSEKLILIRLPRKKVTFKKRKKIIRSSKYSSQNFWIWQLVQTLCVTNIVGRYIDIVKERQEIRITVVLDQAVQGQAEKNDGRGACSFPDFPYSVFIQRFNHTVVIISAIARCAVNHIMYYYTAHQNGVKSLFEVPFHF